MRLLARPFHSLIGRAHVPLTPGSARDRDDLCWLRNGWLDFAGRRRRSFARADGERCQAEHNGHGGRDPDHHLQRAMGPWRGREQRRAGHPAKYRRNGHGARAYLFIGSPPTLTGSYAMRESQHARPVLPLAGQNARFREATAAAIRGPEPDKFDLAAIEAWPAFGIDHYQGFLYPPMPRPERSIDHKIHTERKICI